jgi:hypothetical protein
MSGARNRLCGPNVKPGEAGFRLCMRAARSLLQGHSGAVHHKRMGEPGPYCALASVSVHLASRSQTEHVAMVIANLTFRALLPYNPSKYWRRVTKC